jgi:hypothetical protein
VNLDGYPANLGDILREMQRQISALSVEVKRVTGTPVTQASSAFLIPQTSTPPAPSGAVYLYYDGATLRVRTPAGSYSTEPPDIPQMDAVPNPANVTAGTAPGSYSQPWANSLYLSVVDIKDTLTALMNEARTTSPPFLGS